MFKVLKSIFVFFICISCCFVESANILAIFPYPKPFHYFVVKPYLNELSNRGHQVTLVSHRYPDGKVPTIELKSPWFDGFSMPYILIEKLERREAIKYSVDVANLVLENKQVVQLMKNESAKFDLVIVDAIYPSAFFALAEHFKAHLIGFSAKMPEMHIHALVGNESPISYLPLSSAGIDTFIELYMPFLIEIYKWVYWNLYNTPEIHINALVANTYLPLSLSNIALPMTFMERFMNFWKAIYEWGYWNICEYKNQKIIYEQHFSHLNKTLDQIIRSFALVLINQHFSIGEARPYVPNMVEVGGLFMDTEDEPLPEDILHFIESAPSAVIYMSFGSYVNYYESLKFYSFLRSSIFNIDYRVLWKTNVDYQLGFLRNVMAKHWFPQRAILAHPKVTLFITHGGYLSVMEAIIYGKPIIGIPQSVSHLDNMRWVESQGIGVSRRNESLIRLVEEVLNNRRYLRNIQKLRKRFLDRLLKPLDLAIFWTEYVLRHDGAVFMRVLGRDMSWFTYLNYDIVLVMLPLTLVVLIFSLLKIHWLIRVPEIGLFKFFKADKFLSYK